MKITNFYRSISVFRHTLHSTSLVKSMCLYASKEKQNEKKGFRLSVRMLMCPYEEIHKPKENVDVSQKILQMMSQPGNEWQELSVAEKVDQAARDKMKNFTIHQVCEDESEIDKVYAIKVSLKNKHRSLLQTWGQLIQDFVKQRRKISNISVNNFSNVQQGKDKSQESGNADSYSGATKIKLDYSNVCENVPFDGISDVMYQNANYFSYDPMFYYNVLVDLSKQRMPQPSNKRPTRS